MTRRRPPQDGFFVGRHDPIHDNKSGRACPENRLWIWKLTDYEATPIREGECVLLKGFLKLYPIFCHNQYCHPPRPKATSRANNWINLSAETHAYFSVMELSAFRFWEHPVPNCSTTWELHTSLSLLWVDKVLSSTRTSQNENISARRMILLRNRHTVFVIFV